MKKVRIILIAITVGLFMTANANAQQKETKGSKPAEEKQFVGNLKPKEKDIEARLALTEEQKGPYREIIKKYKEKMKDLKAEDKGDKTGRLKAVKTMQIDKDAEVKGLLNETQYKTYLDIKAEKKAAKKEKKEEESK